ncbi:MAG TPA: class I SAM-dependent methyltransferase [Balneolaceae bacterium]|nr:class I SAM-dependent methyltransferase [Balneolaceae bacterium]
MEHKVKNRCRFCGAPLKHTFADLGSSPLANSYLEKEQLNMAELFYPLQAYVCEDCFLVQLEEFESPESIFSDYAYFSSYSDSYLEHSKNYSYMMMDRFEYTTDDFIVEIASNDGYLLKNFVEKNIPVLGIEPANNVAKEARKKGISTLDRFFDEKLAHELKESRKQADLIIGNNVLAHTPNLNDFISGMKILLKPEGVITMEFPHLQQMVDGNKFDTIYHEHFSYFSFITVEKIFAYHGLVLFDVDEIPTQGGSLRIYAKHADDSSKSVTDKVHELRHREYQLGYDELDLYLSFNPKIKETKRNILDFFIKVKREGKSIAGYGAPAKGNTLLNYCGIRSDFVNYTVDKNPSKQNRYLPGTHIPVYSPDKIYETKPDYICILPWNLSNEIMSQLDYVAEWDAKFVTLIPEIKVIDSFDKERVPSVHHKVQ